MIASVTPDEILKTYPLYRVATQKKEGENVELRNLRCANLTECLELLRRIIGEKNLGTLAFFEVHELHKDGTVTILIESSKDWPRGVARSNFKEEYTTMPRPKAEIRNAVIDALVEQKKQRQQERLDSAAVRLDQIIAEQRTEMQGKGPPPTNPPPTTNQSPEDDELGRPVFSHKRGVA